MLRHEIINTFIKKHGYKTYLEIGLDEGNHRNDDKVICETKISVDPAEGSRATFNLTSDQFFKQNKQKFDIVFIDGLHHEDQVTRDIENSLHFLNEGGTIVCHDCNPTSEAMQAVPRIQGEWTGDVWKSICHFRNYKNLEVYVVDTDYGVGIIKTGKQDPILIENMTYSDFEANKKEWLNLISVKEFIKRNPLISVCIPTFEQYGHGVKNLAKLLDSLKTQKGIQFEIVVSDNSKDNAIDDLCKRFPMLNIKYVRNDRKVGISNNTNNAIEHASAERIKIMYMDDILLQEDALLLFYNALNKKKWAVSKTRKVDAHGRISTSHTPMWNEDILKGNNTMGMPSILAFHKNEFRFDPKLKTLLDCDFMWQMWDKYDAPALITQHLVGQRYHDNSTSTKQGSFIEKESEYLKTKYKQ